jgi:hypothetical protein
MTPPIAFSMLDVPDVGEPREVLVVGPHALRRGIAIPEVLGVHVFVLDRDDHVHDERALDRPKHARHEVDALEHHRPAFLERTIDRRLDADEDLARLIDEAEQERVARLLLRGGQGGSGLEARVVD